MAFDILGTVGAILDLPDAVEFARQTIKKGRADVMGAIGFLEVYFGARKAELDKDFENTLLAFSKRATRRGLAVGALNLLVKTGAIDELEACDRIDDWKTEHWGCR